MSYSKQDVRTHSLHRHGNELPAVRVKVDRTPTTTQIQQEFNCSEEQAIKAAQYCWDSACEQFWEDLNTQSNDVFDLFPGTKVYSAGRSGGWAVVEGLPDLDRWDAVMLGKWRRWEKSLLADLMSWECWKDMIDSNRWHEEGAERYNFRSGPEGQIICVSEMKQKAREAGFGPVIK